MLMDGDASFDTADDLAEQGKLPPPIQSFSSPETLQSVVVKAS